MTWRKTARKGFIPVQWIGSKDGRDLFAASYSKRAREFRLVDLRSFHERSGFDTLAEAKAEAVLLEAGIVR